MVVIITLLIFKNEQIMKKKKYLMLSSVAAVAIAAFVGKHNLISNESKCNDLFIENVEALTQGDVDGNNDKKRCATKMTNYYLDIPCNVCGSLTGLSGVKYSCQSKGNDEKCKVGFKGYEVACTPWHGAKKNINTSEDKDC